MDAPEFIALQEAGAATQVSVWASMEKVLRKQDMPESCIAYVRGRFDAALIELGGPLVFPPRGSADAAIRKVAVGWMLHACAAWVELWNTGHKDDLS